MNISKTPIAALAIMWAAALNIQNAGAEEPVWTKGVVTKVKPDAGKVTIRHEEIANLEMPAMKMVFGVGDPAILEQLQPGQEAEFYFVKENGRFIIKQVRE